MFTRNILSGLAPLCLALIAGIASVGCAPRTSAQASCSIDNFSFASEDASTSRVDRARDASQSEQLHGETILTGGRGRVVEDVMIDAKGRMTGAKIALYGAGPAPDLVAVMNRPERGEGIIEVKTNDRTDRWTAPADSPWVLVPIEGAGGHRVPTPVAAMVASRAVHAAGGGEAWVRVIDVSARRSYRTPGDQIAVPTEIGETVIFGHNGVDLDASFVREVRWAAQDIKLARVNNEGAPLAPPTQAPMACGGMWKEERLRLE